MSWKIFETGRRISRATMLPLCVAACMMMPATTRGDARAARVMPTDLVPVTVRDGLTILHGAATDGGDVAIFCTWRDNGNAWSYHVFLVTEPRGTDGRGWRVVGADDGPDRKRPLRDHLTDTPHTGEDGIASIHFARGRIAGQPALLLIEARRQLGQEPANAPTPSVIDIYRLVSSEGVPGWTPDYFRFVTELRDPVRRCDADAALAAMLLPALPHDCAGARNGTGC